MVQSCYSSAGRSLPGDSNGRNPITAFATWQVINQQDFSDELILETT